MRLSPKAKDRRCGFVVNGPDNSEDLPTRICDLRVPCGISGFAEGKANADLLAAAPDLLKVVQAMVADLEEKLVALGWDSIDQYHQRAGECEPHMQAVAMLKKLNAYQQYQEPDHVRD